MSKKSVAPALFDTAIITQAIADSFRKLNPQSLARNPVIFVTEVVAALVIALWLRDLMVGNGTAWFSGQIAAWLWFTVLFANFAEEWPKAAARRKPMLCAVPARTPWQNVWSFRKPMTGFLRRCQQRA